MLYVFADLFFACSLMLGVCQVGAGGSGSEHRLTKRKDLDPQTCVENFDIHRDKIIRTEDSREMGAKYLNEIDLSSHEECLRLCCETDECDVFVFEEKNPGSCYLFRCGPPEDFKCKFTRHSNFTSAVLAISRRLAELEDQIRLTKHEQDLAGLRKSVREEQLMARSRETPATKLLTTTTPIVPTPPAIFRKETTISTTPGRRCSRFQFECHSSGECIAIYNACDGVAQCADGSDEATELECPELPQPLAPAAAAGGDPGASVPGAVRHGPPPAPPKEIVPPPQTYDSSDEPVIQKGLPENRPAFMRPLNPEPVEWPNRLSQMQPPSQNMQMKQYEDNEMRSKIFNHKGGLQVTEAESAAGSQYEYKALPYESMGDTNWQHRQWPQTNPDQMPINDGQPLFHMEQDPALSWKQQPALEHDHRFENTMPRMRQMPQQLIDKYDGENYMASKNKMWPVPQSPMKTMVPQRYPEIMSNSQHNYMQPDHNSEELARKSQKALENIHNDSPNETPANEKKENAASQKADSRNIKAEEVNREKQKFQDKSVKKHLKNEEYEPEAEEGVKEASIVLNHKRIMEEDDDDHDGLSTSPPGAIIILIIGLLMASTMIVMICWRAKIGRRRRRSGKGYAHDADYLVNGMYL